MTTVDVDAKVGGCACGAVRFEVLGQPRRAGLCHCLVCRKAHAAAFNPFVVFSEAQLRVQGDLAVWPSSPNYERRFCPICGSGVINSNGAEVEISLGSFDQPGVLAPEYESWDIHREPWLPDLGLPRHHADRPSHSD